MVDIPLVQCQGPCMQEFDELSSCAWCEVKYCEDCYKKHECDGHLREAYGCGMCDAIVPIGRVIFVDQEPVCKPCFTKQAAAAA